MGIILQTFISEYKDIKQPIDFYPALLGWRILSISQKNLSGYSLPKMVWGLLSNTQKMISRGTSFLLSHLESVFALLSALPCSNLAI